jgi:hypothetical protein
MAELTNEAKYTEAIRNFCDYNLYVQKKTPKGLLYIEKSGTLCHAANIAFLCLRVSCAGPLHGFNIVFLVRPQRKNVVEIILSGSETVVCFELTPLVQRSSSLIGTIRILHADLPISSGNNHVDVIDVMIVEKKNRHFHVNTSERGPIDLLIVRSK